LLIAGYSKLRFQIGFAHRCRPHSTDDDIIVANCINDLPTTVNEFAPSTVAQLVQNCSRFWILKKNLRAIVDAESDASCGAGITARNVTNGRLNIVRRLFGLD